MTIDKLQFKMSILITDNLAILISLPCHSIQYYEFCKFVFRRERVIGGAKLFKSFSDFEIKKREGVCTFLKQVTLT